MGVLNVTPDSFSDGGRYATVERAVAQAERLAEQGAHILDIGGESTRPGAETVSVPEELRRTVPVITALRAAFKDADVPPILSIDTRKPDVARAAIEAGADIWNDVSALTYSPDSLSTAADLGCDIILMHAQGTPETMQDAPTYTDPVTEICDWLKARVEACKSAGIDTDQITLDPGVGFGKTLQHNLAILANIDQFTALGHPILIGASRKSFIGKLDGSQATERLGGSIAAALIAAQSGVDIVRVHDVEETRQAMIVAEAIVKHKS
jgi:dihydropteroate synthase